MSKNNGGIKDLQDYFLKTIIIVNSIQASETEGVFAVLPAMLNLSLIFLKELKRRYIWGNDTNYSKC